LRRESSRLRKVKGRELPRWEDNKFKNQKRWNESREKNKFEQKRQVAF
jgi:hypothetical protein